jgi:hypothetical protein
MISLVKNEALACETTKEGTEAAGLLKKFLFNSP